MNLSTQRANIGEQPRRSRLELIAPKFGIDRAFACCVGKHNL